MQSFAHVTDPEIRATLEGDFSEDSICHALVATEEALEDDRLNPDIEGKALAIREQAYEDAEHAWNEEGDAAECLEQLRKFWSN